MAAIRPYMQVVQVEYWLTNIFFQTVTKHAKNVMQVKYWPDKGVGGHIVYKYLLRRRPDQGELATCRVEFGGKSAP